MPLKTSTRQLALALAAITAILAGARGAFQEFRDEFNLANRKLSATGKARYFVLMPGYQSLLTDQGTTLTITVLDETKEIGGIVTRVVEEREVKNGNLYEVARNYFAMDTETGDTFYFGEDVDFYENGKVVNHKGSWIAYRDGNKPGLIIPGKPEVGMRYYQELAPGVALDRAEVVSITENCKTLAGAFENCLVTRESSKLEPIIEYKTYAPGIGLVRDQSLQLVRYGMKK